MALGPWMGVYSSVVTELMDERKEQELLLLLAITKYCDPFGFCFPGRAALMRARHSSRLKYERRLEWLQERCLVVVTEGYDYRRRQVQFDFQVSPRVIYVRSEIQEYCEAIFDGVQERDYSAENKFLEILFSTKDSQPDAYPESVPRISKPESGTSPKTRNHNQLSAPTETGAQNRTMRNGAKPEQRDSATQRRRAQQQKDQSPVRDSDEFHTLLSPDVDNDRIATEIQLAVGTTLKQAKQAVETYPRDGIVHWLSITARRRQKGEILRPGGFFFRMLQKHVPPLVIPESNGSSSDDDLSADQNQTEF